MDIFGLFQSNSKFLNTFQVSLLALIILFDSGEQSQKLKIKIHNSLKLNKNLQSHQDLTGSLRAQISYFIVKIIL